MDQGVKLAAACGVLVFGTVVALLIPRDSSPSDSPQSDAGKPTATAGRVAPPLSSGPASQWPTTPSKPAPPVAPHRITVEQPGGFGPTDPGGMPPDLAPHYPQEGYSPPARHGTTSRWGVSHSLGLPQAVRRERIHTIVDGDTLEQLAERYLGSAERSQEIYEANRDVLASPRLLPIGKKLRIPSAGRGGGYTTDLRGRRPMIPLGN